MTESFSRHAVIVEKSLVYQSTSLGPSPASEDVMLHGRCAEPPTTEYTSVEVLSSPTAKDSSTVMTTRKRKERRRRRRRKI